MRSAQRNAIIRRSALAFWILAAIAFVFGFCALTARPAQAQRVQFARGVCDWNLAAKRTDGPVRARRYQFALGRAGVTWTASEAVHRIARVRRSVTAPVATFALDLAPHLRGAAMRAYPVDLRDWSADLTTGSLPVVLEVARRSRAHAIVGTAAFVAALALTACYASP